ncbi:hypothetical protein AQUCO_00200970v1 [Aquilegia coerulea]|uniref:Uncharacterized protein n=1 Tax=Aquilegia coerulea TaxID=218851 RepID=A0A2G5F5Z4_AQUCA|nr:hypothetical protein AQUCO_00200970v1 [Aquilegia coerulea]
MKETYWTALTSTTTCTHHPLLKNHKFLVIFLDETCFCSKRFRRQDIGNQRQVFNGTTSALSLFSGNCTHSKN